MIYVILLIGVAMTLPYIYRYVRDRTEPDRNSKIAKVGVWGVVLVLYALAVISWSVLGSVLS